MVTFFSEFRTYVLPPIEGNGIIIRDVKQTLTHFSCISNGYETQHWGWELKI